MTTERRELAAQGVLLYDGDCRYCVGLARRFEGRLAAMGFRIAPLQERPATELKVVAADGRIRGGADGLVYLLSRERCWSPLAQVFRLPGAMALARAGYRWVAERRGCVGGRCEL